MRVDPSAFSSVSLRSESFAFPAFFEFLTAPVIVLKIICSTFLGNDKYLVTAAKVDRKLQAWEMKSEVTGRSRSPDTLEMSVRVIAPADSSLAALAAALFRAL